MLSNTYLYYKDFIITDKIDFIDRVFTDLQKNIAASIVKIYFDGCELKKKHCIVKFDRA